MNAPQGLRHIHHDLVVRIAAAALFLGLLAGGGAYLIESRRVEASARAMVETAVRHFQAPVMQMLDRGLRNDDHREVEELFRWSNLVGLRVHDANGETIYEAWGTLPESTRAQLRTLPATPLAVATDWHEWLTIGTDKLIRQKVRLLDRHSRQTDYLEGFYRIEAATLDEWRKRIVGTVTMAILTVLATAAVLYPVLRGLLRHATDLSSRLMTSNLSLLTSLGSAVAKRDSDTDAHNYRVALCAIALAEAMGLPDDEIAHLIVGAFLHDVGKIGIPDAILLKPGRLTADEFEIMKTHTLHGLDIVAGNSWMQRAADVIRHHHEKFDGSGYPDGQAGVAIPRIARLFAVVDVFDALVSARPYKAPMPPETALAILERDAGKHFDPAMVRIFKTIARRLHGELSATYEADLHRRLQAAIDEYFFASSPQPANMTAM